MAYHKPDINNIIIQDEYESDNDFQIRKDITLKISNNTHYPLNNMMAVTCGRMLCNKMKLGVIYSPEIEKVLDMITSYITY
jgi:hypothetical protein